MGLSDIISSKLASNVEMLGEMATGLERRRDLTALRLGELDAAAKTWSSTDPAKLTDADIDKLRRLKLAAVAVSNTSELLICSIERLMDTVDKIDDLLTKHTSNSAADWVDLASVARGSGIEDSLLAPEMYGLHPNTPLNISALREWCPPASEMRSIDLAVQMAASTRC